MITYDVKISVCINNREHIFTKLAVLDGTSYSEGPTTCSTMETVEHRPPAWLG